MENQDQQSQAPPQENVQDTTTMDLDGPPPLESTQTEQYNQENKKQKLPDEANVRKLMPTEKEMDPRLVALKSEVENWINENSYSNVKLLNFDAEQLQLQFTIGYATIPFQVFLNHENLKPMFITSESPLLEDYITPINLTIETSQEEGLTLTNLLNMFALGYKEAEATMRPPMPHATNFPIRNLAPRAEEKPSVEPTLADFEAEIIPEVTRELNIENFQPYEIDEWVRRITVQLKRGDIRGALRIVRDDIFAGNIPDAIRHFFPRRGRFYGRSIEDEEYDLPAEVKDKAWASHGASSESVSRLQAELINIQGLKNPGFTAGPPGNDLFHWHVKLNVGPTKLGEELMEWALKHTQISDTTARVDQDIFLELKFPLKFPDEPPLIRIIKPKFANLSVDLSVANVKGLSVSRAIERNPAFWSSQMSVADYINQIRGYLLEIGASVDMDAPPEGYLLPTVGNFWRSYNAVTPETYGRPELENGGKIVLPTSALEELSGDLEKFSHPYFGGLSQSNGHFQTGPMLFEVSIGKGKRTYCGVEEFTASEGIACVPQWMLQNIGASPNSEIQIRRVSLLKGNYIKLQPHTADFLQVNDTKAMLEWVLPKFVAMTEGDTIVINYRNHKYSFNVLEVRPGTAIHIIDSDVTTDFAPPLSGETFAFTTPPPTPEKPTTTTTTTTSTPGTVIGTLSFDESKVEGVDYKVCDNCKHKIPMASFDMHSLSCARMNYYCEACQSVVKKSNRDEHNNSIHGIVYCDCGEGVEARFIEKHKSQECKKRIVKCEYCPLEMPYIEKFEHEMKCGSQTELCEKCRKYIQKRDLLVHMIDCESGYSSSPSKFNVGSPYRNNLMGGNMMASSPPRVQVDEYMCEVCKVPFEHFDDLQVHMLTAHESTETMETDFKME